MIGRDLLMGVEDGGNMRLHGQRDNDDHEKDDQEGDVKTLQLPPLMPTRVEAL